MDKLLKIKEVSVITGEDPMTIYRRIREGQIKAIRLGCKNLRISEAELKRWIAAGSRPSDEAQE